MHELHTKFHNNLLTIRGWTVTLTHGQDGTLSLLFFKISVYLNEVQCLNMMIN